MTGLLIIVGVTAFIGLILWIFDRRVRNDSFIKADEIEKPKENETDPQPSQQECCGLHIVCERESLVPFTDKIEYYDDEELDRFKDREPDSYTDEEIEEWREILLTLRAEEIAGWARSIQLREIPMPQLIRDELFLIVSDARLHPTP